ncbi:MAG: alpha/beta hydrolase family protein [Candidatus Dadabacteria bacterium]
MKRILIWFLLIASIPFMSKAQEITGQWNGALKVSGIQLRLVFHITQTENGYASTMDSPDQNAKGIPVTTTLFNNPNLKLEITNLGVEYDGILKGRSIEGTFKQNGLAIPLALSKDSIAKTVQNRPQEPKKPYPYFEENVSFKNSTAHVTLAGTLTLPRKEGSYPVAILISGSGPQNRDEELLGHKPFLIISDYLTRNGIAVLRYDDRGTAQSTGNFNSSTTVDFASDVESAIAYLKTRKEINSNHIGLIGHSEGGLIAPMVAAQSKDVSFIVLLAGPGIPGHELVIEQQRLISKASGIPENTLDKQLRFNRKLVELVSNASNMDSLKRILNSYATEAVKDDPELLPKGITPDAYVNLTVSRLATPWMQFFLNYNPVNSLEKVKCAVLALNGENDLQVPAKDNLEAIRAAFKRSGNKQVTIKHFPKLNHLFQNSKTGAPTEYATIEETFSPEVLDVMTKWILSVVNK